MLDRKKQPAIKEIDSIDFILPEKSRLDNGIQVFSIPADDQEVSVIKFVFSAGSWYQPIPLIALFTSKMLREGTKELTSLQIAELIEFYGADLELLCQPDNSDITLYSLNKHLEKLFPVVEDMVKHPAFPEKELSVLLQNNKQNLIIQREKVKYVARENFNKLMFGTTHPYSNYVNIEDYENITPAVLSTFHKSFYTADNCKIIVAGKTDETLFRLLNKHFGQNDWKAEKIIVPHPEQFKMSDIMKHRIEKTDAVQSAIRIGKPMFNPTHPDYIGFKVLNTIFGGYFGSRLMQNIREDKGYTYGIGSNVETYLHAAYFYIATEVGVNDREKTLDEIYLEINRLKTEAVPEDELQLVKNYKMGSLLRSMDGPFAMAEQYCFMLEYGLDENYFDRCVDVIKNISADEITRLAQKYLDADSMIEVIVG